MFYFRLFLLDFSFSSDAFFLNFNKQRHFSYDIDKIGNKARNLMLRLVVQSQEVVAASNTGNSRTYKSGLVSSVSCCTMVTCFGDNLYI